MTDDRELFRGTAYYYARYRPGYPAAFFEYLVKKYRLDGRGRLLDLGCGTGQLAIPLARYFEEVVGLDPEEEMLDGFSLTLAGGQKRAMGGSEKADYHKIPG